MWKKYSEKLLPGKTHIKANKLPDMKRKTIFQTSKFWVLLIFVFFFGV